MTSCGTGAAPGKYDQRVMRRRARVRVPADPISEGHHSMFTLVNRSVRRAAVVAAAVAATATLAVTTAKVAPTSSAAPDRERGVGPASEEGRDDQAGRLGDRTRQRLRNRVGDDQAAHGGAYGRPEPGLDQVVHD